jgi:TPR repeat protein
MACFWIAVLIIAVVVVINKSRVDTSPIIPDGTTSSPMGTNGDREFAEGYQYFFGEGIPKNEAEGVKWFQKAAELGHAGAQYLLGLCYAEGEGVRRDYAEAVKWLQKAAEQGLADAQSRLGWCYYDGEGVRKDYAEAVKWFQKAAEQGHAVAQFYLGLCYAKGEGVPKNESVAEMWLRKATEQGVNDAQQVLEVLHQPRPVVTDDNQVSWSWTCNGGIFDCWEHLATARIPIRNEGAAGNITVTCTLKSKTNSITAFFNRGETKWITVVISNLPDHDGGDTLNYDYKAAGQ